ncbi:GntR family transcriptional regulator (plasmid) [Paracoccus ferrooxidans]|nr:GntR family transcriptional regulator [Paracoccus ferrooxidans]
MSDDLVAAKPLYAQVRDQLTRRLVSGEWAPGMLIPSEHELARQLRVSQGTVRKALDAMTMDNLLVRRQGRGTFVSQPEDPKLLFQFFRLTADGKEAEFPLSQMLGNAEVPAPQEVAEPLGLAEGAPVVRIERVRLMAGAPVINEVLWLPAARFAGLAGLDGIPNNIYKLLSAKWGVTIARADEQLRATLADAQDAARLGCAVGYPLIAIQRIAYDLEDKAVELRQSRCLTDAVHYSVSLR